MKIQKKLSELLTGEMKFDDNGVIEKVEKIGELLGEVNKLVEEINNTVVEIDFVTVGSGK